MSRIRNLAVLSLVLCLSSLVLAQGGATGAIAGTVQDATGLAIAGANVQIISEATGQAVRTVKTDATGGFTANLLPVGNYTVEVNAAEGRTR